MTLQEWRKHASSTCNDVFDTLDTLSLDTPSTFESLPEFKVLKKVLHALEALCVSLEEEQSND